MPVRKFRSVEEMNTLVWRPAGSPALVRALASIWAFSRRLRHRTFSPGVRKFRSIAEMKASLPSSDGDPLDVIARSRAEYHLRWEAVETFKAQELAAMTDERAEQIIQSLGAVHGWRDRRDWSGLVEQQALFHRARRA